MIGIIGGSGFYELFEGPVKNEVFTTPYGNPSGAIAIGNIGGKEVAFLARHGKGHRYPPHLVPYQANIWALHKLGVETIIAASAMGSLKKEYAPGDFVIPDNFVDRTFARREDTYCEVGKVHHLSAAEVYDEKLAKLAEQAAVEAGITVHRGGVLVVINGPRFSSRAESQWYQRESWDYLSMTQYPENVLARELEIKIVCLGMITDYDAGVEGVDGKAVTHEEVFEVMGKNVTNVRKVIANLIAKL